MATSQIPTALRQSSDDSSSDRLLAANAEAFAWNYEALHETSSDIVYSSTKDSTRIRVDDDLKRSLTPVPEITSRRPSEKQFIPMQRWEGVVESIAPEYGTFTAVVQDRTAESPPELAVLFLEDLSDGDRELLTAGAVFYWSLGHMVGKGGGRARVSIIRLQRLPTWSKRELDEAKESAAEVSAELGWN